MDRESVCVCAREREVASSPQYTYTQSACMACAFARVCAVTVLEGAVHISPTTYRRTTLSTTAITSTPAKIEAVARAYAAAGGYS